MSAGWLGHFPRMVMMCCQMFSVPMLMNNEGTMVFLMPFLVMVPRAVPKGPAPGCGCYSLVTLNESQSTGYHFEVPFSSECITNRERKPIYVKVSRRILYLTCGPLLFLGN